MVQRILSAGSRVEVYNLGNYLVFDMATAIPEGKRAKVIFEKR